VVGGGGLDRDGAAPRWPALPETKVPQDLLADRRLLDHGAKPHRAATPWAPQNVCPPPPAEEIGPREPTGASGIVGAHDLVSVTRRLVLVRASEITGVGRSLVPRYSGRTVSVAPGLLGERFACSAVGPGGGCHNGACASRAGDSLVRDRRGGRAAIRHRRWKTSLLLKYSCGAGAIFEQAHPLAGR
jgi:hypothetical protein